MGVLPDVLLLGDYAFDAEQFFDRVKVLGLAAMVFDKGTDIIGALASGNGVEAANIIATAFLEVGVSAVLVSAFGPAIGGIASVAAVDAIKRSVGAFGIVNNAVDSFNSVLSNTGKAIDAVEKAADNVQNLGLLGSLMDAGYRDAYRFYQIR